ncbi:MAG: diguanylate cyclase [Deltaproteobacteria bacterium]|jgi:diguanylate cyclase (GGDEF)-like protein
MLATIYISASRLILNPMEQILLVEDSRALGTLVREKIQDTLGIKVQWVQTFRETVFSLMQEEYCLAILDLTLPDSRSDEVVDFVLSRGVPVIIFAARFDRKLHESFWSKMIVDYVLKDNPANIDYLVSLVRRLFRNRFIDVLVVDNSESSSEIANLLTTHKYNVFCAEDGLKALALFDANPRIKLVIAGDFISHLNGIQLIREIRSRRNKEEVAVIGISDRQQTNLPAKFLKNGANDFITRPFASEEFYCRVTQNIELLEYIETIRNSSNTDYLTGLYNRRYFFELGRKLFASMRRGNICLAVAMVDIDLFKRINDTYGHEAGDAVLKQLAALLKERFRATDIVSRYGGEEFCILAANMAREHAIPVLDRLRQKIEEVAFDLGSTTIQITASIGICHSDLDRYGSLEEMIKTADTTLYMAKEEGRNRIRLWEAAIPSN